MMMMMMMMMIVVMVTQEQDKSKAPKENNIIINMLSLDVVILIFVLPVRARFQVCENVQFLMLAPLYLWRHLFQCKGGAGGWVSLLPHYPQRILVFIFMGADQNKRDMINEFHLIMQGKAVDDDDAAAAVCNIMAAPTGSE